MTESARLPVRQPAARRSLPDLPLLSLLLAGLICAATASAQVAGDYRIGAGDTVSISVLEGPEFDQSMTVDRRGAVEIEGLGILSLEGLSVGEAEQAIERRLEAKVLKEATVTLLVERPRSSQVTLLGAVASPGQHDIGPSSRLIALLTGAGGLDSTHSGVVQIRRTAPGGATEQIEIPIDGLLYRAEPRYNLPLADGDLINVPPGRTITVYFAGEISGDVQFDPQERQTLIRAVSKAGGLTERSSGKLEITRTEADGTVRRFIARYKRILRGEEPDIELRDGDVINVKRSIF